jgi:hypothetical protein
MIRSTLCAAVSLLVLASTAHAQQPRAAVPVRTFPLHRLSVKDAAKLLAPYLQSELSGAFETGSDVHAITVRGTARELHSVDSLLAIFDRAPRSVLLRFQIIEATEDATKDPRISEVDASLRDLFRYAGYRLAAEGIARTEEAQQGFEVSLGAGGASYTVRGVVRSADDAGGTMRLSLSLEQPMMIPLMGNQSLFSTQLVVPVGQVVVLGSASPRFYDRKGDDTNSVATAIQTPRQGNPIILTVRPEFIGKQ